MRPFQRVVRALRTQRDTAAEVEELRARVAELEDEADSDGQRWASRELELNDCIRRAEARVAELEAAAKPRPMSEAPRDCQFGAIVPLTYDRELSCERSDVCYLDREGDLWGLEGDGMVGMILGWLPLPDERKEGE